MKRERDEDKTRDEELASAAHHSRAGLPSARGMATAPDTGGRVRGRHAPPVGDMGGAPGAPVNDKKPASHANAAVVQADNSWTGGFRMA